MLTENMKVAFSAIRANKMRSALTMLGIIIGIGSVISIVSTEDIMGGLFADLYKDAGITRAYVSVGYWLDDVRQSDYFILDEMERAREAFKDEVVYIDSSAYTSADVNYKRTRIKFRFQGIDYNYQDVQPVNTIYGRYLNKGDILGRKKNAVMDTGSALKLFGIENVVGKSFRITIYGSTEDFTVVDVYRKNVNALQALVMGGSNSDKGAVLIPYILLTQPNDYFYQLHVYAKDDVNLNQLFEQFKIYAAKMHGRQAEDMYMYTATQEMTSVDAMMGGLSMVVGGIVATSLLVSGTGIMSIMLVSVTERIRGIGIRKALGARTQDVLIQFPIKLAILSACGGIVGVVMGMGFVPLGGLALGMPVIIKPGVTLVAVPFLAVMGIFFGLYPVSKAAKPDPIDALHYK